MELIAEAHEKWQKEQDELANANTEEGKNHKGDEEIGVIDNVEMLYKEFTKIQINREELISKFSDVKKQNDKFKEFIE